MDELASVKHGTGEMRRRDEVPARRSEAELLPPPASTRFEARLGIVRRLRGEHQRVYRRLEALAGAYDRRGVSSAWEELRSELLSLAEAKIHAVYPALRRRQALATLAERGRASCLAVASALSDVQSGKLDRAQFMRWLDHIAWLFQSHAIVEEGELLAAVEESLSPQSQHVVEAGFRDHKHRRWSSLQRRGCSTSTSGRSEP